MRIPLFSFPAASLVVGAITLAMWCRSYRVGDDLACWYVIVSSGGGSVEVFVATRHCFPPPPFRFHVSRALSPGYVSDPAVWRAAWPPPSDQWAGRGFAVRTYRRFQTVPGYLPTNYIPPSMKRVATQGRSVVVPYGLIGAIEMAPLVLCGWRAWRRATRKGLCHRCGYDLRATPDRCPECGEPARTTRASEPGGRA